MKTQNDNTEALIKRQQEVETKLKYLNLWLKSKIDDLDFISLRWLFNQLCGFSKDRVSIVRIIEYGLAKPLNKIDHRQRLLIEIQHMINNYDVNLEDGVYDNSYKV